MAVVLETSDQSARIGFQPGRELGGAVMKDRQTGNITLDGVRWAKAASGPTRGKTPTAVSQVLSPGDVIYADPLIAKDGSLVEGQYRLRQLPEISGAMVAMDPLDRPRARHGRRVLVRPEPVQSRDPGLSAAGLDHQADRLFLGASTTAIRRRAWRSMPRSRSIRGRAAACGVRRTFRSASILARRRCATR